MVDACGRKTNSRYQLKNKTNTELSKQNKQTNTQTKTSNQKSKISILKFTTTVAIIIYTSLHSVAHTFYIGDSLFILLSMWASYSPRESLGMLAAQALTMTPETKHSPKSGTEQTVQHTISVSGIGSGGLMRRQSLQRGSV